MSVKLRPRGAAWDNEAIFQQSRVSHGLRSVQTPLAESVLHWRGGFCLRRLRPAHGADGAAPQVLPEPAPIVAPATPAPEAAPRSHVPL